MSVPNTNTFRLSDVVAEIGLGSTATLADCFANATGTFDPLYEGSKDRLSNFRNYSHAPAIPVPVFLNGYFSGPLIATVLVIEYSQEGSYDEIEINYELNQSTPPFANTHIELPPPHASIPVPAPLVGDTYYFRMRAKLGSDYSAWSVVNSVTKT